MKHVMRNYSYDCQTLKEIEIPSSFLVFFTFYTKEPYIPTSKVWLASSGWRQQGPPQRWYPITSLHSVKTQKTRTWSLAHVS